MPVDLQWLPENKSWKLELAGIASLDSADRWNRLVQLANYRIDFLQSASLDRVAQKHFGTLPPEAAGTKQVRLAVLASSTADHLLPAIRAGAMRRGIWCRTYTNPYGQYLQTILDDTSDLEQFQPTAVLLALDAHHVANFDIRGDAADLAQRNLDNIWNCWRTVKKRFGCTVLQQTVLPIFGPLLGNNEHRLKSSPASILTEINCKLREAADAAGVHLLAVDQRAATDGLDAWYDPALWHRSKQEISPRMAPFYGDLVGRTLAAAQGRSYKCLVLDLDNTLWGGVIGDDGLSGIQLGQNTGIGEAYVEFQKYLLQLASRGVILAVCSKNDEKNALEPFEVHPEMVLRKPDIACFCINWLDKASNLRVVAESLNIGLDSLVFVDDNPFEREQVRRELPMVAVPELPDDPALYPVALATAGYFEALDITAEDQRRGSQYKANLERGKLRESTSDMDAYLESLGMKLSHGPFDSINLKRVVQLINKTNQFNLTTRRYSEEETRVLAADARFQTHQFRLIDRFGDNGIICVVIGEAMGNSLRLDTWLMSCRVFGRQVEDAVLNVVAASAVHRGLTTLTGTYCPTEKNGLVRDLFSSLGFQKQGAQSDGTTTWALRLDNFSPRSTHIQVPESSYATK